MYPVVAETHEYPLASWVSSIRSESQDSPLVSEYHESPLVSISLCDSHESPLVS